MKKLILFLLINISLLGFNYDNLLLKAQANIYPKLILLDKDIDKKLYNNTIIFTIVYHDSDYEKAKELEELIYKNYQEHLGSYKLKIQIKEFKDIKDNIKTTAIYILKGLDSQVRSIIKKAQKLHVITFSYELKYLKKGALISLHIEDETNIYFNNEINKLYKIKFLDIFYQVVRYYHD